MAHKPNQSNIRILMVVLLAALPITVFTVQPQWLSQLSYAVEVGQAKAAEENLAVASDLSQAFRDVAKALRPSVVSISSTKRIAATSGSRQFRGVPEEFRGFFDDDTLQRFFQQQAPRGGFTQEGLGSGVIVREDGYILTNYHVAGEADEVTVTLSDGRELRAEIVGGDKATDIAVLKIDAKNLKPAKLGKSATLEVGEWVLAMGSPFGLDQTVTAGIVSATGRADMGITDYEDFIQTDAAINPGNSGGPLLNLRGEVVGINTAIATRSGGYMGVGFAIPSEMAGKVMQSIIDKGFVTRGFLGALIQDLSEELASSFNYESTNGVLIGDVVDDGPAAKAGLRAGDIVTKFNGDEVASANELRNAVAETAPGTKAKVEIFRDGDTQTLTIEIEQLDQEKVAAATGTGSSESASDIGVTVDTLTPQLATRLNAEEGAEGVVVTGVESGGLAARAGLQQGDIILSVGSQAVTSTAEFRDALKDQDLKKGIRLQVMRNGATRFVFLRGE